MLQKQIIIDTAKDIFPEFQSNPNWFDTLDISDHEKAFTKLKNKLCEKSLYDNIDLVSILNLGDIATRLLKKYPKDVIINAMIEDSIYSALSNTHHVNQIGLELSTLIDEL